MKPAAQVGEAATLLDAIDQSARPADDLVQGHFRARRFIGSGDRREISHQVFGTMRHQARLSWLASQAGLEPTPRARLILFLHLVAGKDVPTLFNGDEPHSPEPLNEEERRLLDVAALEPPEMPEAVRAECPPWAEAELRATLGESFAAEMAALAGHASLDLRAARRKGPRERAIAKLVEAGFRAGPTPLSPDGIRISGRSVIRDQSLFRDGAIEVQDEGSQIAALMCDVSPGMQVIDFCAGAGGKSLALGDVMEGRGRIVACDVSEARLAEAKKRLARAGLDNIEPRVLKDERDGWVSRQKGKFDRVLVDAPCSGSGAWRRSPWARWREPDLAALNALQQGILKSAARLVKPGGRLVYVTCSLLDCENRGAVQALLAEQPGYRLVPPPAGPQLAPFVAEDGTMLLTPLRAGTDGFFIAVLERTADG